MVMCILAGAWLCRVRARSAPAQRWLVPNGPTFRVGRASFDPAVRPWPLIAYLRSAMAGWRGYVGFDVAIVAWPLDLLKSETDMVTAPVSMMC